ncbi:CBS domain-containing protein [Desulforhopalus singaporensis]|uniref:Acetoin utilization protein AcuB n=1 Tax=Desulforhopalus singaporensis TaxID=91360 RepID=A0A1H0MPS8_9BACT|nr:CBS domain-containing protein [Desulforhopalus singaporensis]SDO82377.1 acetoin utilization protein AcuB [Desulforhopalus singaporensis]
MFIYEYMTSDPITVPSSTLLPEARQILNEYGIRHLPVIDSRSRLIGMVTDRDLRSAYPSSVTSKSDAVLAFEQVGKTTVEEIMTTTCATLDPHSSIDDALILFDRYKIGGIPVVSEEDVVIGFFSLLDLTAAYRKLFGVAEEGSILIGVEDDGRDYILSELTALLDRNNIPLTRLIRLAEKEDDARIFMRVTTQRPAEVYKLLKVKKFHVMEP